MSENLSIDEIIKRAEEIKREAEKQLNAAEKNLDEKAKTAIDEVVVDESAVVERISRVYEKIENEIDEDEDIKEYTPPEKKRVSPFKRAAEIIEDEEEDDEEEDIIIAEPQKKAPVSEDKPDGKTRSIDINKSDRTNVVPDLDNAKTQRIVRSGDDGKTKHVMYVSQKTVDEDSDLQEMPMIVAKEHIYDNFEEAETVNDEDIGIQMTFEGFDDVIESVPTIDEEVAEQILLERRQEKVGKFRLFGPDETDKDLGAHNVVREDYVSNDETEKFLNNLYAKKGSLRLKIIATLWLSVPMLLLTVFKDSAYFPTFLASHTAYFSTACILYAITLVTNYNVMVHGFNLKRGLNYDLPNALTALLIMVHTVILAINQGLWIDNGVLLILAGTFVLLMSQFGKFRMMSRIIDNFKFISSPEDRYTVENIANSVDAEIISRGLLDTEPLIKTSVKTDFPTNFMEISTKREAATKTARVLFPISVLLCVALLIVIGIINNFNTAVNMALCALAITLPCCTLYLGNTMLLDISKELNRFGSRVCGFEGAAMAQGANAMVMEASDLFGADSCEMHGFKAFDGTKVDDAILYTAAVMTQTKSPLATVFDNVIIGKQSILPVVEGVTYENSMGISAWIYKRKVLVGNRDLLIRHGVNVPNETFEKKYTIKGRKALYLAVNGKCSAMFVVSYSANPELKRELRKLEKSGITIIVKSSDPYINEKSIAKLFALPEGFIRVMNYSAARVYDKYSNMNVEKSPAYIVHDGTAMGFVSAMRSADIVMGGKKIITFLTFFGSAIGFATIALLSVLEAFSGITAVNIILFIAIWNSFILVLNKLRGMAL
ncbi:MAG: hypothetical protein IKF64_01245 [Eubacterium sp.]|nr:hypothetical protein [Eubacterium sp.]